MGNSKLFISDRVLRGYGCVNCVWKTYGQCPKGFTKPDQSVINGYCDEFADFLFSLAEGEDSVSAVKEKFMLYTQEMQALSDHRKFSELVSDYSLAEESGVSDSELAKMRMAIESYKLWWSRLTESVVKGLGRISDRESRSKDVSKSSKSIGYGELNRMLKESSKVLELDNEGGTS